MSAGKRRSNLPYSIQTLSELLQDCGKYLIYSPVLIPKWQRYGILAILIWWFDLYSNDIKLSNIRITGAYEPWSSIKVALDDLLSQVQHQFSKLFPAAKVLDWFVIIILFCADWNEILSWRTNVKLHAHENAHNHACLDKPGHNDTVQGFYEKFLRQRWGTKTNLADRSIEVRFVYIKLDVVRGWWLHLLALTYYWP